MSKYSTGSYGGRGIRHIIQNKGTASAEATVLVEATFKAEAKVKVEATIKPKDKFNEE